VNPFSLSLDVVLAAAPLLGPHLEDRSPIREAQDRTLLRILQAGTSRKLRHPSQRQLFAVAPLDILVTEEQGQKRFHIIELNGTGIGGLTNLTGEAIAAVLENLAELAEELPGRAPVVLVASSGMERDDAPRLNRLIHEKVLYAEALKQGFERSGRPATVTTITQLLKTPERFHDGKPAVVLGYIKDFLQSLRLEPDGRLSLFGRPVDAGVNDRFCLNVLSQFGHRVDLNRFVVLNRCFLAGADKGVAYRLINEHGNPRNHRYIAGQTNFARVHSRGELLETVLVWLRAGRKAVIKPQGTGLGHGIEFFLDPHESREAVARKIDDSLRCTEQFYRARGGAFPYTVCEFLDTCTVRQPGHRLDGHKYELRVVVYRDGDRLQAFPSIAKVSSEVHDPARPSRMALINNVTTSAETKKTAGTEFMLPLCNRDTLRLLDLKIEHLRELCGYCTGLVAHVLDRVQDRPDWFGLPGAVPVVPRLIARAA